MPYGAVTVSTSAKEIVASNGMRRRVVVQNNHASNDLYLGDDDSVATTSGLHLVAGDSVELHSPKAIYGIASAASTDVRYYDENQ